MSRMRFRAFVFLTLFALVLCGFPSSSISQGVEVWSNLGLYGGQIYDIAIDPSNPDKMFAGSYMGDGLFVTEDGGSSWRAVETENEPEGEGTFKNHAVWKVKIASSNNNVIWVAHNYWVEKSTDGGETWTHILNSTMQGSEFRFCRSLTVAPSDPQTVYVGTGGAYGSSSYGAIYKTVDGGLTWRKTGFDASNEFDYTIVDIDIDPQNHDVIWAVTSSFGYGGWGGTLYRSIDGGANWEVALDLGPFGGAYLTVAAKPGDPNTAFTGSGYGIIKHWYDEGEKKWFFSQPCPQSALVEDISFDPQNSNIVYAVWLYPIPWGGDGIGKVARSFDGGDTWLEEDIYSHDYDFLTIAVHPVSGEILLAGDRNLGVYKSQDHGQTWTPFNNGINAVIVYDVAIDPNDSSHILAGTISGVYEKKPGEDWSRLLLYSTRSLQFHPADSLTFYAGIDGWLAKTADGGQSWTYSNMLADAYNYVSDIAIDPTNTDTIFIALNGYGIYGEIHKSTDGGDTFEKVLDGENQGGKTYGFNVVAIDPSDPQHIFAGGGNFYTPKVLGDLWESTDGGDTWTRTGLQNVIVNALLMDPRNPNIMYAGCGYSGGMGNQEEAPLYKSTDGEVTWTKSYEGIPGYPTPWNAVTDLEFHPENRNVIYASTNAAGVYISPNQARNWLNLGTPDYDVYAISTSSLYAATQGGLLQCTGTGVIAGEVKDALSGLGIDGATVFNDMGVRTLSINGEYMMVSPCGICCVTAIASVYANTTEKNKEVLGGDVTWVDIDMESGIPDPSVGPGPSVISSSGGGSYCFIATAAYGSSLAKQLEILRAFRDDYLLLHPVGQKLVGLYYSKGKSIARYIESHPWLRGPARVILYPVVGLAWLLPLRTAFAMGVIGLCVLIGYGGVIRSFKLRCQKT